MPDTLPVHLNREQLHSLSVPASFETADSFVIAVRNHGEAARVHVHLDDTLSEVATVDATNHYVRAQETAEIPVAVHEPGEAFGKIKIVSGYGAVTRWIDVTLTEPDDDDGVEVDEDLAKPQPADERQDEPIGEAGAALDRPNVPVLLFGAVAITAAVAAAVAFGNALVAAGAVVVLAAVLAAGILLLR